MTTFTPDKVSPDKVSLAAAEVRPAAPAAKPHTGPVARLLAQVSKLSSGYADYQMEQGVWRKLAL